MLAAAAAVSSNSLMHGGGRHRRRGVLQFGQRLPVRGRVFVGDRGLVDAQGLAELHRAALERAEHLEDLFRGAALQFVRYLVPIPANQALPESEGGPSGGGNGQAC
jgi:hypothetical protein